MVRVVDPWRCGVVKAGHCWVWRLPKAYILVGPERGPVVYRYVDINTARVHVGVTAKKGAECFVNVQDSSKARETRAFGSRSRQLRS
jgi:hypothetical protein